MNYLLLPPIVNNNIVSHLTMVFVFPHISTSLLLPAFRKSGSISLKNNNNNNKKLQASTPNLVLKTPYWVFMLPNLILIVFLQLSGDSFFALSYAVASSANTSYDNGESNIDMTKLMILLPKKFLSIREHQNNFAKNKVIKAPNPALFEWELANNPY